MEEIKLKKGYKLTKYIIKIQKHPLIISGINLVISFLWFLYISYSMTLTLNSDFKLNSQNVIDTYTNFNSAYPNQLTVIFLLFTILYALFRLLIFPAIKVIKKQNNISYKILIDRKNSKGNNEYYILKVNHKHFYLCEENSFYSNSEVFVIEKDKLESFSLKYTSEETGK
jgi:hypothetical protein